MTDGAACISWLEIDATKQESNNNVRCDICGRDVPSGSVAEAHAFQCAKKAKKRKAQAEAAATKVAHCAAELESEISYFFSLLFHMLNHRARTR